MGCSREPERKRLPPRKAKSARLLRFGASLTSPIAAAVQWNRFGSPQDLSPYHPLCPAYDVRPVAHSIKQIRVLERQAFAWRCNRAPATTLNATLPKREEYSRGKLAICADRGNNLSWLSYWLRRASTGAGVNQRASRDGAACFWWRVWEGHPLLSAGS